jgi:hypothetical protein
MKYAFHPEAEQELYEAAARYESEAPAATSTSSTRGQVKVLRVM